MNALAKRTLWIIPILALVCTSLRADTPQAATARIVAAANAFLSTLDESQKKHVMYPFDDDKQRATWSNLPTSMVPRGGIKMGDLNETQRTAAMALVASALSPRGFEKVQQIMQGDELLKRNDRDARMFGKNLFYISILGTPSEKSPWMLQFGGHHLALNITVSGENGILTPSLTGAQPALYQLDGKTVRPLGAESDKALALLNTLDEGQKKRAILSFRMADLVLGPGQDGKTIQPEGLKASDMNEKQRAMLLDLISEWVNIAPDTFGAPRMAEIKSGLDDTWFAWSGPDKAEEGKNIRAYFRVQGPKLVIEYAPQNLGGDPTLHVHTMYRDPTNDYGRGRATK